jgi:hypothetical protein
MKKLIILLVCFIFPLTVYAKEDIVTIENMNSYIMILDMDEYSYEETANVSVNFGDNPNTYYFYKSIPKVESYRYTGKSKSISYNVKLRYTNIPDNPYFIDYDNKKKYLISVGTDTTLLSEDSTIKLSYTTKATGRNLIKNKEYHFDIAGSHYYDINKTNFKIIFTDIAERGTIYFSNNGKDYFKTLDGLTYKVGDYSDLNGTYNKIITKGNTLSIKIVLDEKDSNKIDFRKIVVYGSFGIFLIFVLSITYKILNRKK